MRPVLLALLVVSLLTPPGAASETRQVGRDTVSVWVEAGRDTLELPRRFLRPSECVVLWRGHRWAWPESLTVQAAQGRIVLPRPLPQPDSVRVAYAYLPLDLPEAWQLRELVWGRQGEGPRAVEKGPETPSRPDGTRLRISGSKTVTVEVGSHQDLALKQSLDLSVTGNIGPDVRIQAILTDRETPLQPEGTTRELEDLDQVFLRIQAPGAQVDLGDVVAAREGLRLASFHRVLEGAVARVERGGVGFWAVGAVNRGEFRSLQFFGEEGRQGPYRLLPPESEGVVVAGSETVWLDGEKLRRGETEDYVIDYATGELTFTSRRPITSQSEIVVDYEMASQAYRRRLYVLGAEGKRPGGLAWKVTLLREADDRRRPLNLVLSPEETERLREVGDGEDPLLDGGITFVGPGQGDYEKVLVDSLPEPIYRYVGPDSGSYDVRFVDVGEGKGSYADSTSGGRTFYVYVGEKRGRFKPGRPVPRPISLDVADVALRWEAERYAVDLEGAVSRKDANTFSGKDDADNADGAYDVRARLAAPPLRILHDWPAVFSWRARLRQVGSRYAAPGRLQPGFYEQDWGAEEGRLDGRERMRSVGMGLSLASALSLEADLEALEDWKGMHAERTVGRLRWAGPVQIRGRWLRADSGERDGSRGRRWTEDLGLDWTRGAYRIRARYLRERSRWVRAEAPSGWQFRDVDVTLQRANPRGDWSLRLRYNFRRRWREGPRGLERENDGDLQELEVGWQGRGPLQGRLLLVRRRLLSQTEEPSRTTYLGRWEMRLRAAGGLLRGNWRGEASTEAARLREKVVVFVGEGQGHYDALGRYVGRGDYDAYLRTTGAEELRSVLETSLRWELSPGRRASAPAASTLGQRLWREAEWTLSGRVRTETPEPLDRLLARPAHWWGEGGEAARASVELRSDLRFLTRSRLLSPSVRGEIRRNVTTAASTSRETRELRRLQAGLLSLPRGDLRLEVRQSWEAEEIGTRLLGEVPREDVASRRQRRTELRATWRMQRRLRLRIQASGTGESGEGIEGTRRLYEFQPALILTMTRGRAELRWRRTWVRGQSAGSRLFTWERPGSVLSLTTDLRLAKGTDLSLFLENRRREGGTRRWSGRFSLRAFF
jgi:hypothetical protein